MVLLNLYSLLPSGSGGCSSISTLVWRLRSNRLHAGAGLESSIANVDVSARAVNFVGFHAAVYEPEGMDVAG